MEVTTYITQGTINCIHYMSFARKRFRGRQNNRMQISVNSLINRTQTFKDNRCVVGCCQSHSRHIYPSVFIRNVPALGEGHVTCSQLAPKQFTLIFMMDHAFITVKSNMYIMYTLCTDLFLSFCIFRHF